MQIFFLLLLVEVDAYFVLAVVEDGGDGIGQIYTVPSLDLVEKFLVGVQSAHLFNIIISTRQ